MQSNRGENSQHPDVLFTLPFANFTTPQRQTNLFNHLAPMMT